MRFLEGLTKVVRAGAAYVEHVQFAEKAQSSEARDRPELLAQYVQGLTDASFAGFKLTLRMLAGKEKDAQRQAVIESLLVAADGARAGRAQTRALVDEIANESFATASEPNDFDADLKLVHEWFSMSDENARTAAVQQHVLSLGVDQFKAFFANLKQMRENVIEQKRAHEANEGKAWGGYIEDQIAYRMARLSTGARDPEFMRQLREFEAFQKFVECLMTVSLAWKEAQAEQITKSCEERLGAIEKQKQAAVRASDAERIKSQVREFTKTRQYPGGVESLTKDLQSLTGTPAFDELMAMLNEMGVTDGGENIQDFYVPGDGLFELRWPLGIKLPMPFDQLDRPTQFSVLFTEWKRRTLEGDYAVQQGKTESAKGIYEECMARAQQLGVNELVARTHENLAKVASRTGGRSEERKQLKAALAARENA
jgi:hypothetical protein